MIYAKTNPRGLDALISKIQATLHNELNVTWGLVKDSDKLEAYERCYILNNEGKNTVNRFIKKKEYRIISVAEKSKFFFLQRAKAVKEDAIYYKSEVEVIFIVDLDKIKNVEHRGDLEAQNDVELLLSQFPNVWIINCESGYQNALTGIDYQQENDMQPYHAFKFTLGVHYDMNAECCC